MDALLLDLLNDFGMDAAAEINEETDDPAKIGWFGWSVDEDVLTLHFRSLDIVTDTEGETITRQFHVTPLD